MEMSDFVLTCEWQTMPLGGNVIQLLHLMISYILSIEPQCFQNKLQAFNQIEDLLTNAKVMAYFDPSKDTELITDASPWGLSAILMQKSPVQDDSRVVAYASRTLTDVERRYSRTEREMLAIVWAVERFHVYLYSSHFTLVTDCKPVQLILDNPQLKPPARIERWNLRLQGYIGKKAQIHLICCLVIQ